MVTQQTSKNRSDSAERREFAKRLRHHQTDAENVFWYNVRSRRLAGFKFRRQYLVGPYIVDFACLEAKLVVELDGSQHALRHEYDRRRDAYLAARGFRVMRIWNVDMLTNRDGVLDVVLDALRSGDTPSP